MGKHAPERPVLVPRQSIVTVLLFMVLAFTAARGEVGRPVEKLHDACRRSDLKQVQALLTSDAPDLHATTGPAQRTALHWAVEGRASRKAERRTIVALLLEHGAPVNARTVGQETALELACTAGWDAELLQLLLKHGAAVDPADPPTARTPLLRAVARLDFELVQLLLAHGANVNAPSGEHQDTPLMAVYTGNLFPRWRVFDAAGTRAAASRMLSLLLAAGADVHAQNKLGETALHGAVAANDHAAVLELMKRGLTANARVRDGRTLLHYAVLNSTYHDREVLQTLVRQPGLSLNAVDEKGNTPLHEAVRAHHNLAVQSLLLLGADAGVANAENQTPRETISATWLDKPTQDMLQRYTPARVLPAPPPAAPQRPSPRGPTDPLQVHLLPHRAPAAA